MKKNEKDSDDFWHRKLTLNVKLALFDTSPLHQFSKLYNFLWVCWFLGKNLFNFVPHPPFEKLNNPYYHKLGLHILASSWLKFSLGPAYYIQTCQLLELKAYDSYFKLRPLEFLLVYDSVIWARQMETIGILMVIIFICGTQTTFVKAQFKVWSAQNLITRLTTCWF